MDFRILEKINVLKNEENEKRRLQQEQEMSAAEKDRLYIESRVPDADKWIDSYLLDEIARVSVLPAKDYLRSIQLNDSDGIPILSKVKAIHAKRLGGITVVEVYVPEDFDPNDESHRTMTPPHFNYYISWSVKGL
jgi:hypothetical protein